MLLYARLLDEETKECEVINQVEAEELGWEQLDLEVCQWNSKFYLTGHSPNKPEILVIRDKVNEARRLLEGTDWCIVKIAEADTQEEQTKLREKYAETIKNRKEAREIINMYENTVDDNQVKLALYDLTKNYVEENENEVKENTDGRTSTNHKQ